MRILKRRRVGEVGECKSELGADFSSVLPPRSCGSRSRGLCGAKERQNGVKEA